MIKLENLTIGYGERILLDSVSVNLDGGQIIALLGRNGSGKSSLLRVMSGMDKPLGGVVRLGGKSVGEMSHKLLSRTVSLVTTERIRIPNLYCKDIVAFGRAPYTDWVGRLTDVDYDIVNRSLRLVGMSEYANKTMDCMSDGECQRIMIARALAQDTDIILLDEPTSFLDLPNRYELVGLLKMMAHKENKCILFSTHELDIALTVCDSILLINNPEIYYDKPDNIKKSGLLGLSFKIKGFDLDSYIKGL